MSVYTHVIWFVYMTSCLPDLASCALEPVFTDIFGLHTRKLCDTYICLTLRLALIFLLLFLHTGELQCLVLIQFWFIVKAEFPRTYYPK